MRLTHIPTLVVLTACALATATLAAATAHGSGEKRAASLRAHVLQTGELSDFRPERGVQIVRSAERWTARMSADAGPAEAATLRRLGFVAAATVHLVSPGHHARAAVSKAIEFDRDDHARIYLGALAAHLADRRTGHLTLLCVIGLPDARQIETFSPSGQTLNLLFQQGRVVHLISVGSTSAATGQPTMRDLLTAAQALVRRVA